MIAVMSSRLAKLLLELPGRAHSVKEGAFLFHRGDPVESVMVITAGVVELLRHQPSGQALVLQRAQAAAVVAEASMFAESYHCDAVAATPATVHAIPRQDVRDRLRQQSELVEAWAAYLAQEVQNVRLRSEILTLRTVAARLDAWLDWHPEPVAKGEWKSVAAQIGVSPEALYRELAKRRS